MINDDQIRNVLRAAGADGARRNPGPRARSGAEPSARRGTREFDDLMDDLEREWELDDEELDHIVEIRRAGDSFEIRFKGSDEWEFLEDDEDEGSDDEDSYPDADEDFGGEEE